MIDFDGLMKAYNKANPNHPLRLDDDQMRAVMADENIVVGAGAGSGKTTVLSWRFLKLMLDGIDCDRILTLTFTQKAAREMKGRIASLIQQMVNLDSLDSETRKHFQTQWAEHFPNATISTLDSFCSQIVRSDAISWGLTSDFTIDEDTLLRLFSQQARQMLWRMDSSGAKVLSSRFQGDQLIPVLARIAKEDYHLTTEIPETFSDDFFAYVEQQKKTWGESFLNVVDALFETYPVSTSNAFRVLQDWRKSVETDGFDKAISTYQVRRPGKTNDEFALAFKEIADQLKAWKGQIVAALELLPLKDQFADVMAFLRSYAEACNDIKRRNGMLCYGDVSDLAVEILRSNVSLRRAFGGRFDRIMIDEFQDNNELQRKLLFLLSAKDSYEKTDIPAVRDLLPNKLFFVGDEKQSIYRFRGADVSVFKALARDLGTKSLKLETNYRTERPLIELFATLFEKVMQPADGSQLQPYEAEFTTLQGKREGHPCSMTILMKPRPDKDEKAGDDDASTHESEAYHVAQMIRTMLDGDGYRIWDGRETRRPQPGDIAILMRTGTHQMDYEKALRHFGIPYTIDTPSRSLMLESVAGDLYAVMQLLVHPEDTISYIAVLRSPFVRLDDASIEKIARSGKQPFDPASCDHPRYQLFCTFFHQLQKDIGVLTLPALLQRLWLDGGYRMTLVSHPSFQAYLDHYTYLEHIAEVAQDKGLNLVGFLAMIRPYVGSSDKVEEADEKILTEEKEGVRMMTIHAAKGLQWPIVFVVNLGASLSHADTDPIPIQKWRGVALLNLAEDRNAVASVLNDPAALEEEAEAKRLLYVAMTRAESHLVLSGAFLKTSSEPMLQWICKAYEIDEKTGEAPQLPKGIQLKRFSFVGASELLSDRSMASIPEDRLEAIYSQSQPAYDLSPNHMGVTTYLKDEDITGGEELPVFPSDEVVQEHHLETGWGTLCHELVQRRMGLLFTEQSEEDLVPGELMVLSKGERKRLLDSGRVMAEKFVQSDCYKQEIEPWLAGASCEERLYLEHEGMVLEGSIDLLVEKPGEILIIDFKTDRSRTETGHYEQVELYGQAMHKLKGKNVRAAIVYLRDPTKVVWWNIDPA